MTPRECQIRLDRMEPPYYGEKDMDNYQNSSWTNDSWTVSWKDQDVIEIKGPYNQICYMDGGDFENVLSALCAAFMKGWPPRKP